MRYPVNRDLSVIHCLEQGALGLRCGAVYLICKNNVRKDRAWLEVKGMLFLVVDGNAYNIRREEVTCKLYPLKCAVYGFCKAVGECCLANPRNIFYEEMAPCKEGCYRLSDNLRFALDYPFKVFL